MDKTVERKRTSYGGKLSSIKSTLNLWTKRNLTLVGKVQIVNTLVVSKLVNLMTTTEIYIPDTIIREYHDIIIDFLDLKKINMPYKTIIKTQNKCGLNLTDIKPKDLRS